MSALTHNMSEVRVPSMIFLRLAILASLIVAPLAMAQTWTFPAKGTGVLCTGCGLTSAEGRPTFPYDDPLTHHAGRYVDSTTVPDFQGDIRTLRANLVRSVPERGRLYVALGSAIGVYSLETFFTTSLRKEMADVRVFGRVYRGTYPYEKVTAPEAFFNAESSESGWVTPQTDGQIRLFDFDGDDRGYVYIASGAFGWGIEYDSGAADGTHLQFVHQKPFATLGFAPGIVVPFRIGSSYYVAVAGTDDWPILQIYDVTTPSSPVLLAHRESTALAIRSWARDAVNGRLAVVNRDGKLRIFDFAALAAATNNSTIPAVLERTPATGAAFGGLAFDANGTLWVAEGPSPTPGESILLKLTRAGSSYAVASTSLGTMAPADLDIGGGYLAVVGRVPVNDGRAHDLRLFRMTDGAPQLLDISGFFQKYYHALSSQEYAIGGGRTLFQRIRIVEEASKTYLLYGSHGLGDVYELERGDAVKIATSTALEVSPLVSAAGEQVTLRATVVPATQGNGVPTGAVSFTISDVPLTTAPLVANGSSFEALVVTTALGKYPVTVAARYEGDDHHNASDSNSVLHEPDVLTAPENVDASFSAGSISVTWTRIPGISRYQILRRHGSAFELIHEGEWADGAAGSFADPSTVSGAVYVYRVRGVNSHGTPGLESVPTAVAKTTFSDTVLWGRAIKAQHILELRAAVNAYRAAVGLSEMSFADAGLARGTAIRSIHVAQLRDGFNDARAAVGLSSSALPLAPVGGGVLAEHLEYLRTNVQ